MFGDCAHGLSHPEKRPPSGVLARVASTGRGAAAGSFTLKVPLRAGRVIFDPVIHVWLVFCRRRLALAKRRGIWFPGQVSDGDKEAPLPRGPAQHRTRRPGS